jgi:hypothetical protein
MTGRELGASAIQVAAAAVTAAAEGVTGADAILAPVAAAVAVDRLPGASSGRRAGGVTASGQPTPTVRRTALCTAKASVTAGHLWDAEVVMVAAATNTTVRTMADSAAAAADVAEGVGTAADTYRV